MDFRLIYDTLYNAYGEQYWWPADSFEEIIIGTILTQNTNWTNVEKAIANLKRAQLCGLSQIANADHERLAALIRPSGYFNQKAKRLQIVARAIDVSNIENADLWESRKQLLSINGIGPETADSILLYAFNKPIFVVDTYTKRMFMRLGLKLDNYSYETIQTSFMNNLEHDVQLFNEYHALIVRHCKVSCKAKAECLGCCLEMFCYERNQERGTMNEVINSES